MKSFEEPQQSLLVLLGRAHGCVMVEDYEGMKVAFSKVGEIMVWMEKQKETK